MKFERKSKFISMAEKATDWKEYFNINDNEITEKHQLNKLFLMHLLTSLYILAVCVAGKPLGNQHAPATECQLTQDCLP